VQAMRTTVAAKPQPRLGQLVERHAAQLIEIAEAVADDVGIALADEGAARAPACRATSPERSRLRRASRTAPRLTRKLFGHLALGRQLVAALQLTRRDAHLDLGRYLVGEAAALDRVPPPEN